MIYQRWQSRKTERTWFLDDIFILLLHLDFLLFDIVNFLFYLSHSEVGFLFTYTKSKITDTTVDALSKIVPPPHQTVLFYLHYIQVSICLVTSVSASH